VEITWLGQSCFKLKGKETVVIIDPYPPDFGYPLGNPQANILALTHSHPGHSYVEGVEGEPKAIRGPGEYEIAGVFITGIACFHDDELGKKLGGNTIYHITLDDLAICHLGDLGHVPSPELVQDIGDVEVLLVPVGGVSTIDAVAAAETVRRLEPKIVIPMHYRTPAAVKKLEPVDRFLKEIGIKEVTSQPKLSLTRSTLPFTTQVILLDYPRSGT
jgi:L-ascorbate metabolism protein UlaG (beta-lactamase superfamily)